MNDATNPSVRLAKLGRPVIPRLNRPLTDLEVQRLAAFFDIPWEWKQNALKKQAEVTLPPAPETPPRKSRHRKPDDWKPCRRVAIEEAARQL